jgi:CxxC motif-containing protein (DUF1111 family)
MAARAPTHVLAVAAALPMLGACAKGTEPSPDAGSGAAFKRDLTDGSFGDSLPGVTEELQRFLTGRDVFQKPETVSSGVGPVFNQPLCSQCHDSPPAVGGTNQRLEVRFGRRELDGGFDPLTSLGGTLLHDHGTGAVSGHTFAGEVLPPEANVIAPRRTQPLFGLGLVEATPDSTFRDLADSQHAQAPEAAGRPASVTDLGTGLPAVGRFGWKANIPTLLQFAGDAALNEMGITSPQFPDEVCPSGDCSSLAFNPLPTMNDSGGGPRKNEPGCCAANRVRGHIAGPARGRMTMPGGARRGYSPV